MNLDKAGTQVGSQGSHLYIRPLSHPLSSSLVVRMRIVCSSGAWLTAICFDEKTAERKKGKVENKGKQASKEEREGWGRRGSKCEVSSQTI